MMRGVDMKSFTDLFIKRPVLALVVSFVILIAGLQAMRTITVRQYPRSDIASITITTVYVGADAELVRGFITTPLERAIAAADGIDYIQSQSKQGQSVITVRLKLNYDANKALSDIRFAPSTVSLARDRRRRLLGPAVGATWRRSATAISPRCAHGANVTSRAVTPHLARRHHGHRAGDRAAGVDERGSGRDGCPPGHGREGASANDHPPTAPAARARRT